jgi:hypothetical protein
MGFYDRDGNPIDLMEWARLIEDFRYKIVAQEHILTPSGTPVFVSTVWLGVDHAFRLSGREVPILIFETMVFMDLDDRTHMDDLDMVRYSTEEQAIAGHNETVMRYREHGLATFPELLLDQATHKEPETP